ncbi:MAG TPA: hypothetical protein VGP82_16195 [Ktedonobacterales bacterium]|jgi:uncharacterized cupredoxin-like copper-binding protein|nr:hypothetical protein [Ktedonobacterales bacterium]
MKLRFPLAILVSVLAIGLAACGGTTAAATSTSTASTGSTTPTSSGPTTVQVTLVDFKIESSLTTFKVGVPYHFVVTNNGTTTHEFMALPVSMETASEDARDAAELFEVSELDPGKTGTKDYTFTKAYPAGIVEFACHVGSHFEAGMKLPFTVSA